jgi:hypothetical protein
MNFLLKILMPRHKLTKRIFSRIQNSTRDYFDSSYHKSATEIKYFKIIAENQIIVCYRCLGEIKMGHEYVTNHKYGRGTSRKYYHAECYDSLYQ